jgi:hypothetical protein
MGAPLGTGAGGAATLDEPTAALRAALSAAFVAGAPGAPGAFLAGALRKYRTRRLWSFCQTSGATTGVDSNAR